MVPILLMIIRIIAALRRAAVIMPEVYMIDQLEDQFGLGIKKHPLSIRNFLRWARANYSDTLKRCIADW